MARLSLRDRILTPPVARAMLSPSGVLLAGAGAVAVLASGLPLVAVPIGAVLAWGVRVAVVVPRQTRPTRIDPFTLAEPWRRYVVEALEARARFDQSIGATDAGPLRSRLEEIGDRIQDGVESCWRIARRGQQLVEARGHIDTDGAARKLAALDEEAGEPWTRDSNLERTGEALRSQLETARRMDEVIADSDARLRSLDARLDEAVARGIELSVQADDASELSGLGGDIDGVVSELEALRQAIEETSATPPAGTTDVGTADTA